MPLRPGGTVNQQALITLFNINAEMKLTDKRCKS